MQKLVNINGQEFSVEYQFTHNKNAIASVKENRILVKLPLRWPEKQKIEAAQTLEKRIFKKIEKKGLRSDKPSPVPKNLSFEERERIQCDFLDKVKLRVEDYNIVYFKSVLGKVSTRHNTSKWGSCSKENNISINFALHFLPQELLDYVIVHELAHTKERNHSSRFWVIVERIIPDYKVRRNELRKYNLGN